MATQETASVKTTSLSAIQKSEKVQSNLQNVDVGMTTSQGFDLAQRAGKLLAASSLVPKDYQGNLPNCVIALNMAFRIGADPLMVMQNLYIVHGRPSWSSQFLIATFNKCGRFSSIKYEFFGDEGTDEWGCRAHATEKETGEKITGAKITIAIAKKEGWYSKNGSKWQSIPQQMLMYRAASWLVRAYAPELAMGLQTQEELQDIGPINEPKFTVDLEELRQKSISVDVETSTDPETGEITEQPASETD